MLMRVGLAPASAMSIDEKIRLGLIALSVVSSLLVALHFGHISAVRPPLLDEIGGAGSHH